MFRPEMLLPMGLPEDVVVIAWGLSLERCALCAVQVFEEGWGWGNVLERGEGYRQTDTDTDTDRHPHPPTQTHVSVQTRPTMIKYGYSNIRDLIGPKVCQRPAAPSHFTHIVVPFHPPLPSFRSLLHGCPFAQVNLQAAKEKPVVRLQ